jgi:hypothetical protein
LKRVLSVAIATVLSMGLLAIFSVSALAAAPDKCRTDDAYKITVFDGSSQEGQNDSFCIYSSYILGSGKTDARFNASDWASSGTGISNDIGDTYNMHDQTSSFNIKNRGTHDITVCVYSDENLGGNMVKQMFVPSFTNKNYEQGWQNNDSADSLRVYDGDLNCPD